MRRIVPIIFLLSLLTPVCITSSYLKHKKHQIKKQVKEQIIAGLDLDDLTLLTFTLEESDNLLRWEHSHEFEYDGFMYDIVEADTVENTVSYWCWKDHEESEINRHMKALAAETMSQNPQQKERQKNLIHFFQNLYVELPDYLVHASPTVNRDFPPVSNNWTTIVLTPPSPPPNCCPPTS